MPDIYSDRVTPVPVSNSEKAFGLFGLLLAGVVLFISIDVLTGGRLSRPFSGFTTESEEVENDE
jgi:hypothetical protein